MKYLFAIFYNLWKVYVGLVFLITLLLFYPLLFPLVTSEKLKKHSFKINVFWSNCIRLLCFYRIKSTPYPKNTDPKIIIANHTSYLDVFFMYSIFPHQPFLFMGKSEILSYPLLRVFFKKLNIPVDRKNSTQSAKAFIRAKQELENGWSIVVFPEGGIFEDAPKLHPFKDGAFHLAKKSKRGILPVTFENNYKLLSDPEYLFKKAMPGTVYVKIHDEISKEEVEKLTIEELNKKSFQKIASFLPKID